MSARLSALRAIARLNLRRVLNRRRVLTLLNCIRCRPWHGGVVEGNMVDCDGMVELWNGMKWWLVVDWNGGLAVAPDHVCAYRFRWDL